MSQYFELHPENPQLRLIRRAAEIVRDGGLIVYPTDSCYALGCHIGDKDALDRIRRIRNADRNHHFTLVCRDLAEIGRYAKVETWQFRMLKAATPGPYTFLLPATKETPAASSTNGAPSVLRATTRCRACCSPTQRTIMSSTLCCPATSYR